MELNEDLKRMRDEIAGYAREFGLDFFDVQFEVLDWNEMNVVVSYGGFPSRYPHWRFGMEYEHFSKSYSYGLTKIYEMVINNDPCYAYLLHSNNLVDQKMVMAHVYGHSDFFRNNRSFALTNRKMIDEMGNHRAKAQRFMNRFGVDQVEEAIDRALSFENLIDLHARPRKASDRMGPTEEAVQAPVGKIPAKDYLDRYVNPKEFLDGERLKAEESRLQDLKIPPRPERDIFQFLVDYAPLQDWEAEVLAMIREEAYYFAPQAQTKMLNEGWATYVHSKIMTERALKDSEVIDYADHHSGTLAAHPAKLNPYKIGSELLRDIEERWNKGRFGPEYERCDDLREKLNWDRKTGLGRKKIFEVRSLYNDVTFLDAFLTEEFCREQKLFVYGFNSQAGTYEIIDRDFKKIKAKLLQMFTNLGQPIVSVIDANYGGRGELLLKHSHEGIDLKTDWAWDTLKNLCAFWKKPVQIETVVEGIPKLLTFDGEERKEQRLT